MMLLRPCGGVQVSILPVRGSSRASLLVVISPNHTLPAASTAGCISPAFAGETLKACTWARWTPAGSAPAGALVDVALEVVRVAEALCAGARRLTAVPIAVSAQRAA